MESCIGMLTYVVGFQHAGSGWLFQFYLPQGQHEIINVEDQWTSAGLVGHMQS